jgi:hypothetical protein
MLALKNSRQPGFDILFLELDVFAVIGILDVKVFLVPDAITVSSPYSHSRPSWSVLFIE